MRIALFPGTFDPFTLGHHSIVKRTLAFMDEVIIGIGINENKRCLLPVEKRLESIRARKKPDISSIIDMLPVRKGKQVDRIFG